MATALKGLAITSTDLVDQGANPEAHIMLYKSAEGKKKVDEMKNPRYSQEKEEKEEGNPVEMEKEEESSGSEGRKSSYSRKKPKSAFGFQSQNQEEDEDSSFEKGTSFQGFSQESLVLKGKLASLEEENRVALAKMAGLESELLLLKKSLRMKEMEEIASGFSVIGKRKEELAPVLFAMGEAGEEIFQTYVKSLEEQVDLMGKRDLFAELGSEIQGTVKKSSVLLGDLAQEICKRDSVTMAQAMVTAFEENPTLAREYEEEMGGL